MFPRRFAPSLTLAALALTAVTALAPGARPAAADKPASLAVESWLVLGPVSAPLPAFYDAERHGALPADLLAVVGPTGGAPWPAAGDQVALPSGGRETWRHVAADEGALSLGRRDEGRGARLAWLAARVDAERFVEPTLVVRSPQALRIYLDGTQVAEKEPDGNGGEGDGNGDGGEVGSAEASLTLEPGPHLVMVRTVAADGDAPAWTVAAELTLSGDGGEMAAALALTTGPTHGLTVSDLLDVPEVEGAEVSADGELVAVTLARPAVPSEDREGWLEIRRAEDGSPVRTFRGVGSPSGFAWAPAGHRYLFSTSEGEATSLWVGDLDRGTAAPLVEGLEGFGGAQWSPDGSFLVFTLVEEEEEDDSGFKRLRAPQDRWPGWRGRGSLYQVAVPPELEGDPDGMAPGAPLVRRLTAGDKTASLLDVAPDGSRLLFTRTEQTEERPYSVEDLYELDLATLEARLLRRLPWLAGALYAPDGRRVLLAGGPSTFGSLGQTVGEGRIPNDYDGQAYLWSLEDDAVTALTRDFDPAVVDAAWAPDGRAIYLLAGDGPFQRIFRHDLTAGAFSPLVTDVDVVGAMDLARDGSRIVFQGSSASAPHRVLAVALGADGADGNAGKPTLVLRPGARRYADVELGRVEDFSFTASTGDDSGGDDSGGDDSTGTRIVGRVHYPPGVDPATAAAGSFPAIVYYYGGTLPVERSFGGRYPFNLWAAHGYVVYVLQPSGATGFGQELSARHVNDWGKVTAGEIIEGTRAFLDAHPLVDPTRVGCGGASYGGFMTMYLLTETDMFRAAFAHAGISSLSSYWGEGWWGYQYSAVASAESFPWNRPDLYVDQSPLFRADRITTPLLLLHGAADTNVPIGESEQLFVALRLLGREVEMVEIDGQNHHILDYPKRQRWMKTILAWFDRELKDQPAWWEQLYPAEDGP